MVITADIVRSILDPDYLQDLLGKLASLAHPLLVTPV